MHSVMAAVAAKHPQGSVLTVDIDKDPNTADQFNVHSIPCVITLKDGREVERHYGSRTPDEVNAQLDSPGGVVNTITQAFDSWMPTDADPVPTQPQVTAAAADIQLAASGHPAASPAATQFVQEHADSNGWSAADTAAVAGTAAGALGLGLTFLMAKNSAPKSPKKVITPAAMSRPVARPIVNNSASSLWKIGIALAVVAGVGALFLTRRK